jgi:Ca2+/H+ antiporter, TMEM165/GDT1 family
VAQLDFEKISQGPVLSAAGAASYRCPCVTLEPLLITAFLVSTGLVALAEIGDKTQLLALILAARFRRPVPIIFGILVATLANHGLAAAIGAWLTSVISADTMRWILGVSFIAMAIWALVPDKADDAEPSSSRLGIFGTTLVTFFLLEMGDKTQIATVALAAKYSSLVAVVAGTTLGMMIANVPAVLIGEAAARRLPIRAIRFVAAAIFLVLGVLVLAGPQLFGNAVEKVDHAGVQGIFRSHHHQAFVIDEMLENVRAVPQLIGGHADVGAYGMMDQHLRIVRERGIHQRLDGGAHPPHDGMQVA